MFSGNDYNDNYENDYDDQMDDYDDLEAYTFARQFRDDDNSYSDDEEDFDYEDCSDLTENDSEENFLKEIEQEFEKNESQKYDFTKIMELYHNGNDEEKQIAKEQAINSLTGIIHLIIRQHYITYRKNYYFDLVSEGTLGILKGLGTYNPERSKPSTFFYPYIMHEMQSFIDSTVNKTTAHYSSNIRKINKKINELMVENKDYDEVTLAEMTGLSMETIRQALAIRSRRDEINYDCSTEAFINNNTTNNPVLSPEESYLEKEKNDIIYNTLDARLTEIEKSILELSFGLNDNPNVSNKEISRRLDIPIDKVKKYYASALRKLRESELKMIHSDNLKEDENFTLENEVPILPIRTAIEDMDIYNAVEINF